MLQLAARMLGRSVRPPFPRSWPGDRRWGRCRCRCRRRKQRAAGAAQVAAAVRGDGVDILVELTGHTANNRLGVMALRPAPLQVPRTPGPCILTAADSAPSELASSGMLPGSLARFQLVYHGAAWLCLHLFRKCHLCPLGVRPSPESAALASVWQLAGPPAQVLQASTRSVDARCAS